jgi:hypothetical protein
MINMSEKDGKEKQLKAEYPLNYYGLGYRSTLENGPYFKDDVGYVEPMENYGSFCGSCAFFFGGKCEALEEEVHLLGGCRLYIEMALELSLRHQQFILQMTSKSEEEKEETNKYIAEEGGKYCVRSHQTGKSFGCYRTKAEAEKRLRQISRFKSDEDVPEEVETEDRIDIEVKFASEGMDEEKRIVYGIVLVPDEVDYHEDTVSMEEVEKAAHKYMRTPMVIGDGHTKKAKANPVESFIYNPEVLKEVKPGSWVMAVKVHSEAIWQGIKDGDYTGFSIGALVRKKPVPETTEDD